MITTNPPAHHPLSMKTALQSAQLYGILDLGYCAPEYAEAMMDQMLEGGVQMIQLRGKDYSAEALSVIAKPLIALCKQVDVPFIINDHSVLARKLGASGVHVGQDDLALPIARAWASNPGATAIVGKSTHSLEQAEIAAQEGADYIGFGPIFSTPTKPNYAPIGLEEIHAVHQLVDIPIFCIGGIKLENLEHVVAAGARRVVIVSGILQADDVVSYCQDVSAMLAQLAPIG